MNLSKIITTKDMKTLALKMLEGKARRQIEFRCPEHFAGLPAEDVRGMLVDCDNVLYKIGGVDDVWNIKDGLTRTLTATEWTEEDDLIYADS